MTLLKKIAVSLAIAFCAVSLCAVPIYADTHQYDTNISLDVEANGMYDNWDGTSNVAQFIDNYGRFCFAYDGNTYVTVVIMDKNNTSIENTISLKKQHSIFGTAICDDKGNFYLVTGGENETDDTSRETVFISKYDKNGNHVKTVGDDGSSSLDYYYDNSFHTKLPFSSGNCAAAINGDFLSVNYARKMYSGHQSNSVFTVNINSMENVRIGSNYNSHSFAQRVIPFRDGFVYASEGDCYERAFTIHTYSNKKMSAGKDIFHFWVRKNAFKDYNMRDVNNNFAHMGGIANINNDLVVFAGTSARSLSSNAKTENEELFIQIFNPTKGLDSASSFVTSGTRSGIAGRNGDENVTDYGVKWLYPLNSENKVKNPQIVSAGDDRAVVLIENYSSDNRYLGVYYIIIDSKGEVVGDAKCFSTTAKLNPCVMPVFSNDCIYWAGNCYSDRSNNLYCFKLSLSSALSQKGDVDGDGKITVSDLILFKKYILNMVDDISAEADLNDDGEVTIIDYILLKRIYLFQT